MRSSKDEKIVRDLFALAGIEIDNSNPWDIQVNDQRFYRMWRFYLLLCAGGFRGRDSQLWHFVMTRPGYEQPVCRYN